jgi:hypothetical protein
MAECEYCGKPKPHVYPILLPGQKPLVTLRDAALYITKLPKAEHDAEEWQAAKAGVVTRCRT